MDEKRNAVIEKVMKMMELAKEENGGHAGERENASRMAAKLMAEYSLDFADLRTGKMAAGTFSRFNMDMNKEYLEWECILANRIALAFDVVLVMSKTPYKLFFCGTSSDIDISVYFFKYLRRTVSVQSSRAFKKNADVEQMAFSMVQTIGNRLNELYEKRQEVYNSDSRALMVIKTDGLKDFVGNEFPHMGKADMVRSNRGSWEAQQRGHEAGKKVNLHRPIAGSGAKPSAGVIGGSHA